jgi:hypothetical protein
MPAGTMWPTATPPQCAAPSWEFGEWSVASSCRLCERRVREGGIGPTARGSRLNEFQFVELQVAHGWVVGKWHPEASANQDRDADLELLCGGLEAPEVFGQESNTSEVPAPSTLRCAHYPIASCADPADLRLVYLSMSLLYLLSIVVSR